MPQSHRFLRTELPAIAGMAGAAVARTAIKGAYESRRGTEPPVDPGAQGVSWQQAVIWTGVLAAGAGIAQLLVRYFVGETVDKRLTGSRQLQTKD